MVVHSGNQGVPVVRGAVGELPSERASISEAFAEQGRIVHKLQGVESVGIPRPSSPTRHH